jgi:hypothetical protein
MKIARIAWLVMALAGCSVVTIHDRYGNTYGDWYNPGEDYTWQLSVCEAEMDRQGIALPLRKLAMRCCMWLHGVPIDDPQACGPATG